MIRPALAATFGLGLPVLSVTAQDSPAAFFPSHTYCYAQLNPFSCVEGFTNLKLAKLLEDETLAAMIDQALESMPPEADPRAMLDRYPLDRAMGDCIAIGVPGFTARTAATATAPSRTLRFPEDGAVSPDLFSRMRSFEGAPLIAIEAADADLLEDTLVRLFGDMVFDGDAPTAETVDIDGTEIKLWEIPGTDGQVGAYTAVVGGYFLVAMTDDPLIEAVARYRSKRASLATRSDFMRFERHRAGKPTAAFVHFGIDSAIELFSPTIPRADREEIAMWGGFDYSGLQLGLGFDEGAFCEWLHLAFAENPQGIFMNLARLWPSWGVVQEGTSQGTVFGASLTFDWAAAYAATDFVMRLFDSDLESMVRDLNRSLGMDLQQDVLAALGSTMGAMVVMPRHGFIPEASLVFKVRNRVKLERMLGALVQSCQANGVETKQFNVPGGGSKGTYLNLDTGLPIKPAFAVSGDSLVVSVMPLTLKHAITKSRSTGRSVADLLPQPKSGADAPMLSYFFDPAPMARDLYADLLKLLDSSDRRLPIEASDLPDPEVVAASLSRCGIEFSMDPYFMTIDLHSPTGIGLPLMLGGAAAMQMQAAQPAPRLTHN